MYHALVGMAEYDKVVGERDRLKRSTEELIRVVRNRDLMCRDNPKWLRRLEISASVTKQVLLSME